jgi:PAS domain S-box-containing protein
LNILHIDDNRQFIKLTKKYLNKSDKNFNILEATTPKELIKNLEQHEIDCVLSDYKMPDKDGLEILKLIREKDEDLPFILLTGKGSEEIASQAMSAGATDYFRKNGHSEEYEILAQRIDNAVSTYRAEKERRQTLKRIQDGFIGLDCGFKITYCNEEARNILQIDRNPQGEEIWEHYSKKNSKLRQTLEKALNKQKNQELIEYNPLHNRWFDVTVYPEGEKLSVYIRDITEKKQTEIRNKQRVQQQEVLSELGQFIVQSHDLEEMIEETIERTYKALESDKVTVKSDREDIRYSKGTEKQRSFCFEEKIKSNGTEWGSITVHREKELQDFEKDFLNSITNTIAHSIHRIKQEQELQKFKQLAETVEDIMYIVGPDERIKWINQAAVEKSGYSYEELEGVHVDEIVEEPNEDAKNEFKDIKKGEKDSATVDEVIRTKDGEKFLTGAHFTENEFEDTKDGEKYLENKFSAIKSDSGEFQGIAGVVHNVTEIKREKQSQENKLDEFSSLVSHDLRNPLNLAQGYLDLARDSGDDEDYEVIEKAHRRMENIIDELLLITTEEENVERENIDITEAFKEAFYFAGTENLSYEIEDEFTVYGDRSGLISIFENLISNSNEHNSGEVKIKIGKTDEGFYYEDDGEGIPEEKRDEIFDYGFSSGKSGIGLSIVRRIVEINDWDIEASEAENGGARFEIRT